MREAAPNGKIQIAIFIFALIILAAMGASNGAAGTTSRPVTDPIKKLSGANQTDVFGVSVDLEGDLLAVGIPHFDDPAADAGAVQLFDRNQGGTDNWGPIRTITETAMAAGDHFGISVDLDTETLAVGAYFDDISQKLNVGSVFIFLRDQGGVGNWGRVQQLIPPGATENSLFGISLALDGDTLVVGSREDGGGTGSAYIYERNLGGPENWGLRKKISANGSMPGDQFGNNVAISGDLILIGSPNHNTGNGAAYVFSRYQGGQNEWGQVAQLLPDDLANPIGFGTAVSLDIDTGAVGAPGTAAGGAFFIFEENLGGVGSWGQRIRVDSPQQDADSGFGGSLSLTGDFLLVGAQAGDGLDIDTGRAYQFDRHFGGLNAWGLVTPLQAPDGFTDDQFGYAVTLSNARMAIGAYQDDDACPINPLCNSGSVYIYDWSAMTPTPTASTTATGPSPTPSPSATPTSSPSPTAWVPNTWIYLPITWMDG